MIRLSSEAERQVAELLRHYARLERPEAGRNLVAAIDQAAARIEQEPEKGLPAPRPYLALAKPGRLWTKTGRYWIAYSAATPPLILGDFYDSADIPGRA